MGCAGDHIENSSHSAIRHTTMPTARMLISPSAAQSAMVKRLPHSIHAQLYSSHERNVLYFTALGYLKKTSA